MSVLHIAAFRWKDHVSAQQVAQFTEALDRLRSQMPLLLTYQHGPDLGIREGNFDYGVVAEVAEPQDVALYLDHPLHQEFAREFVTPLVAERRAVQIERKGH